MVFQAQGRYSEAEVIYKQCLDKKKLALGENDPSTLNTMNNLAMLYYKLQKYSEAEVLYKQCLDKQKAVLGENAADTLSTMQNLALVYYHQKLIDYLIRLKQNNRYITTWYDQPTSTYT